MGHDHRRAGGAGARAGRRRPSGWSGPGRLRGRAAADRPAVHPGDRGRRAGQGGPRPRAGASGPGPGQRGPRRRPVVRPRPDASRRAGRVRHPPDPAEPGRPPPGPRRLDDRPAPGGHAAGVDRRTRSDRHPGPDRPGRHRHRHRGARAVGRGTPGRRHRGCRPAMAGRAAGGRGVRRAARGLPAGSGAADAPGHHRGRSPGASRRWPPRWP